MMMVMALTAEIETLKKAYAALNRGDAPGFVRDFDPEIERVELLGLPMAGTYRGITEVTAHVMKGRGTWAEGSCEPERFETVGNRVIVSVSVHVRLKNETEFREGRVADVFTFKNGKVTEFRSYADERAAMEWARSGC
jgi:uncharacterized protein